MTRFDEAAALLVSARRDRSRLPGLPDGMRPGDPADAYAIQHAASALLGGIGGWKVGVPNPNSTQFSCAPLPAGSIHDSPAVVAGSDRGIEAEIAVRIGRDLPPRATPYDADELLAAIASAHPAIEVLETRFDDPGAAGPLAALADSLSNHSLVLGPAIADWTAVDLVAETVAVRVGGEVVKRGQGNPGGEMLRMLVWLANEGSSWAGGLRAGQVVTTGSWTGKDIVPSNTDAEVRFAHCGAVGVRFEA